MIGTTIEFFDFYIYATAAVLAFPRLFFPTSDPSTATLASLATFGIAFFARPIGSALFGHFGDRVGRKTTLVAALLTMGFSTVAIGLLPTYASLGIAAPALLALCRFGQGLGLGGEWGGAVLLAVENAPPGRRAWYGMRKKMEDHRVRQDCVQCHRLMDPIGFSLENFDAIGLWRSHDEGEDINPKDRLFDNTQVDGPVSLREWLAATYGNQFVTVATEKLLTYALGRGVEAGDMPLVRAITHDVLKNNGRFSAIVLGIVRSQPFQVNMRSEPVPGTTSARVSVPQSGVN